MSLSGILTYKSWYTYLHKSCSCSVCLRFLSIWILIRSILNSTFEFKTVHIAESSKTSFKNHWRFRSRHNPPNCKTNPYIYIYICMISPPSPLKIFSISSSKESCSKLKRHIVRYLDVHIHKLKSIVIFIWLHYI